MMKATGIVRRIDDLGRIVVPKELRKQLGIKEGEPIELFIDEDKNIVLSRLYNRYKLEVWAFSCRAVGSICIDEIKGSLDNILSHLKTDYRFTESEAEEIMRQFTNVGIPDYSINLYNMKFYIEKEILSGA